MISPTPVCISWSPRVIRVALLLAAILTLVGCGTAEYEKRYNKTIDELWRLEPFLELQAEPTDISLKDADAKDPVAAWLRLPKVFDNFAKRYDPAKTGDEPIDPERMLPPFVRSLPGFRFSYERFLGEPTKAQQSVYFYACATEGRNPEFAAQLETSIRKAYQGFKSSELREMWKTEEFAAPDKSKVQWNRLSLALPKQSFAVKMHEVIDEADYDGLVEVFVHSDGDRHVMFILRMPTELEQQIDLAQLAEAVAGTLTWSDSEKHKK